MKSKVLFFCFCEKCILEGITLASVDILTVLLIFPVLQNGKPLFKAWRVPWLECSLSHKASCRGCMAPSTVVWAKVGLALTLGGVFLLRECSHELSWEQVRKAWADSLKASLASYPLRLLPWSYQPIAISKGQTEVVSHSSHLME